MKVSMILDRIGKKYYDPPQSGYYNFTEIKFAAEYKGLIGIGSTWMEAIKNCMEMIKNDSL